MSGDAGDGQGGRRGPAHGPVDVHKFGGAALADGAGMRHAAGIAVERASAARVVVVASALAGVTDSLISVTRRSLEGDSDLAPLLDDLHARHVEALASVPEARRAVALDGLERRRQDLARVLHAVRELGAIRPRERARILAYGERSSAWILTAHLGAMGAAVEFLDATEVIVTVGEYDDASPDLERTRERARAVLREVHARCAVAVVPGFIGRAPDGAVATLGRGGSDLTATLLARTLHARSVTLWKDVPGLLTADPRAVPEARIVPRMCAREALELSRLGARVLHPRALAVLGERTRVWVRPFANPLAAGTQVTRAPYRAQSPVRAIAASLDQSLVTVSGGPRRCVDPAVELHRALACTGIPTRLLQLPADEGVASIIVRGKDSAALVDALRRGTDPCHAMDVQVRPGLATLGVVGVDVGGDARVAARVLHALADAGIDVVAADMASGRDSVTLVVDGTSVVEAQRAVHAAFRLQQVGGGRAVPPVHRDVVLLGLGGVGRELVRQLLACEAGQDGRLRICGLVDSSGFLFEAGGIARRRLERVLAAKEGGQPLLAQPGGRQGNVSDALRVAAEHALSHPTLVDATVAEIDAALHEALEHGWDLVLANKLPLAGAQESVDRLRETARRLGRQMAFEATVGAGLPVIDTLLELQLAGDTVRRVEGCPSGTLGFIFAELGRGVAFSDALRTAMERGYTEPDPRVDLSGGDVARKALILGRLLGYRGELAGVEVESLVPEALAALPGEEFVRRLHECDAAWARRVADARAQGRVLRYRIRVTRRSIRAGVVAVPDSDSLSRLAGTDNQFTFTTTRYREQPLVITGPGAGAMVTAAGVLGDLLRISARAVESREPSLIDARRSPGARSRRTVTRVVGTPG